MAAPGVQVSFSDNFFSAFNAGNSTIHKILNPPDRIKGNTNAYVKLLEITSIGMEFLQKSRNITSLNPAIRVFGSVGAVYDALQIVGTIHNLAFKAKSYYHCCAENKKFFNKKNTKTDFVIDLITDVSFGVANLGSSLLWANQHKLIDLGYYTIQSIGGIAVGSASLLGAITVGAGFGFAGLTAVALKKLNDTKPLTDDERTSNMCTIAWSVTEIALIVMPTLGFSPVAPLMIVGSLFAKTAALGYFIHSKN